MNTLLELQPGQLCLLVAPRRFSGKVLNAFTAHLAVKGPVQVLDGGNQFDVHTIARLIRRQTAQLETTLKCVAVARAFTCYQMIALLQQQPVSSVPVLVLDLLSTFCDENVPVNERLRLLDLGLEQLRRLSRQAPVIVSISPLPESQSEGADEANLTMLKRLEAQAGRVWRFESQVEPIQPRLF
jgi:hypothetical protein